MGGKALWYLLQWFSKPLIQSMDRHEPGPTSEKKDALGRGKVTRQNETSEDIPANKAIKCSNTILRHLIYIVSFILIKALSIYTID